MLQVNIATNLTICDEVSDDDDRLRVVTDGRVRAREFLHWAPNFYAPAAGCCHVFALSVPLSVPCQHRLAHRASRAVRRPATMVVA